MRTSFYSLMLVSMLLASTSFSNDFNQALPGSITFAVVQEQFVFDASSVASASIIEHTNGGYRGLHVKLKPTVAKIFERITSSGVNKQVNLVFNNKIVASSIMRSSLQDNLLIAGISREDAQAFIDSLRQQQQQQKKF